jgi:hypothetical protein
METGGCYVKEDYDRHLSSTTWDDGVLIMPAGAAPGDTWTSSTAWSTHTDAYDGEDCAATTWVGDEDDTGTSDFDGALGDRPIAYRLADEGALTVYDWRVGGLEVTFAVDLSYPVDPTVFVSSTLGFIGSDHDNSGRPAVSVTLP